MKTCPLLLRVFCNTSGRHNQRHEYNRGVPGNELQIYTWLDATLKELTRLITEVYPNTKVKGSIFNFAVCWPNPRQPGFIMKDIGFTTIGTKGPDDNATLKQKQFVIGDYLDVAVQIGRQPAGSGTGGSGSLLDRDVRRDNRGGDMRDMRDTRDMRDMRDNRMARPYRDYR